MQHLWFVPLMVAGVLSTTAVAQVYPDSDWATATPESVGMDSAKLQFALNKAFGHAVCVRSGYIVGVKGDPTKRYKTYSVGKSLTSLVLGNLKQQGLVKYSDPVPGSDHPVAPLANYKQMMSMVSDYGLNPHQPSSNYAYNNKSVHHYGESLRPFFGNASPTSVLDQALFNIIGRQDAVSFSGLWSGWGGGFEMSGRDLARVGYLVLRDGKWKNNQLISKSFIADLYKNQIPNGANQNFDTGSGHTEGSPGNNWWNQNHLSAVLPGNYSLGWWTNESNRWPGLPQQSIYAEGLNDHRVFVSPAHDLVVVNMFGNGFWNPEEVFKPFVDAVTAPPPPPPPPPATINGELKKWHDIGLTWTGPMTNEGDAVNPFLDYRLDVTFTKGSRTIVVPGYYAADGDAANSGVTIGEKWRCHFVPDEEGEWEYVASFRSGPDVAIDINPNAGAPVSFDGSTAKLVIGPNDKVSPDLRAQGRLTYQGSRYLRFAESDEAFIKNGTSSPENLLAYEDFDATTPNHRFTPHLIDWQSGDPEWGAGSGHGIIGALNYLAQSDVNSISFLTMNIQGDGSDVWPWTQSGERYRFDCSKLDQWEIVFSRAGELGLHLHVVLQEGENAALLDAGFLGMQRKLYYREMIARFSHHLALTWGVAEEFAGPAADAMQFADNIRAVDPWDHPISIHHPQNAGTPTLSGVLGHASIEVASLNSAKAQLAHQEVASWVEQSVSAGHAWVVGSDEFGPQVGGVLPDLVDPAHDVARKNVLWPSLMAGAHGNEWYFGYGQRENDLTCEDFRSRDLFWSQTGHATLFWRMAVPFEDLVPSDGSVIVPNHEDGRCSADPGETYVIYLPTGGDAQLDFGSNVGVYTVRWYDPRNGGSLQMSNTTDIIGPGIKSLGSPPSNMSDDWVVLVERVDKWLIHYGQGLAGQNGQVPVISGDNPAVGNLSNQIHLAFAEPNSMAGLLIGDQATSMPLFGGTLLTNPYVDWLVLPTDASGEASHPFPIPNTPSLAGTSLYFQWLVADPAATQGVSFTQGMQAAIH